MKKFLNKSSIMAGFLIGVLFTQFGMATPADDDFKARCDAVGVVKCMGFDTDAGLEGKQGGAKIDKELKASGAGSMYVEIGPSASSAPGNVVVKLGAEFAEKSSMFLQWRQRFSPKLADKTDLGGEGFKQVVIYDASPGGNVEVAMLNMKYANYPVFYTAMGASYFEKKLTGGDITRQWHGDTVICTEKTQADCMQYQADKWMTFYYEQHIGDWGKPNSTVKVWMGVEGEPLKQFIDISDYTFKSENANSAYRTIWIGPYSLGRTGSGFAAAATWYDEFIISKSPIAAPQGATTGIQNKNSGWTANKKAVVVQTHGHTSNITISFPSTNHRTDISIYDMRGNLLKAFARVSGGSVNWDASNLRKGIYLLKVNAGKQDYSQKVSLLN